MTDFKNVDVNINYYSVLGLTSEGPSGAGDDAWGFFDEGGNWVSLEGEGQRYLQTQEDLVR